ncbi:uncharacterized protein LOC131333861 [Rhododendron vialii]|uniref:uncharacterized protein LOC131333861 n=1 Tax=Rhododendron vialii TaxID=182163 RepID=UPI00265E0207|nr:uncharacterized protein LOC131333861 [Rhododendron vialii]
MASQQPPARPWFRLASMARPASAPTPAPAPPPAPSAGPPAPQPRPTFVRPIVTPTFITPVTQPPPPQEPISPPPPPSAPQAPVPPSPQRATQATAPPPPEPRQPTAPPPSPIVPAPPRAVVAPPSPPPPVATTPSVLTSPIIKASTPSPKSSPPTSTTLQIAPSSLPPSPKPRASYVPSSPLPTKPLSPSPAAPAPPSPIPVVAPTAITTAWVPTQTRFPKIGELTQPKAPSPPPKVPSPQIHPLAHPPSPLTLPPAQFKSDTEHHANIPPEAEQKTILVQETIGTTPKVYVSGKKIPGIAMNRKQDLTRDNKAKEHDHYKKLSDSEEFGMRVITIAGENKGAIMELGPTPNSQKKHEFGGGNPPGLHMKGDPKGSRGGGKLGSDGSNSSNEEGRIKSKDKSDKTMAPISSPPLKAFMNSNVQGVNNSILFNSSCTHHDPGVHLSLSRKPNGGGGHGIHIKDRTNG